MKTTKTLAILVLALGLMVCPAKVSEAAPMGTGFTYQGRLVDDNSVANGQYDFQFKVFDNPDVNIGKQWGSTIYINKLNVIDGNFTVELDFGSGIFYGDARWLEIGVRPGGSTDSFTILSPLQEVKPTPNAIHATHALQADEADTLNGFDSTAFASIAHSHDGVYALIGHAHDGSDITTGTVADGLIADSIARDSELTWGNLAGIPDGFLDGIDNIGGTDSDWKVSGDNMYSGVAGNVGIGTSSPLSKLSVGGKGISNTGVYGSGSSIGVWGSGSSVGVWGEDSDSGSSGRLGFATHGVYGSGSMNGVYGSGSLVGVWGEDSDSGSSGRLGYGDYGGYFSGDGYFSGNVGIGTTTPGYKLTVTTADPTGRAIYGSATNSGDVTNYGGYFTAAGRGGAGVYGEAPGSYGWGVYGEASGLHGRGVFGKSNAADGYAGYFAGRGYFSGNVGIGTTSPDNGKLEVNGEISTGHGGLRWKLFSGVTGRLSFSFSHGLDASKIYSISCVLRDGKTGTGIAQEYQQGQDLLTCFSVLFDKDEVTILVGPFYAQTNDTFRCIVWYVD